MTWWDQEWDELLNLDDIFGFLEKDWEAIGRATLAQLPEHEHGAFIAWLGHNYDMLRVYEKSPGRALRIWHDSAERYQLEATRLPEGF